MDGGRQDGRQDGRGRRRRDGVAVVLGACEIGSAIAVTLARLGFGVALSHDPRVAVLKRGAAFYDALFGDAVSLSGVAGSYVGGGLDVDRAVHTPGTVAVTALDPMDLIACGPIDLLVDARQQDESVQPDLRWLARRSCGIGAGWYDGVNCDAAVAVPPLARDERTLVAPRGGDWYTPIEVGMRVFRRMSAGNVGGASVQAPCDGIVVGILRDGQPVRAGTPLLEIAPKARQASVGTLDPRGLIVGRRVAALAAPAHRPRAFLRVC